VRSLRRRRGPGAGGRRRAPRGALSGLDGDLQRSAIRSRVREHGVRAEPRARGGAAVVKKLIAVLIVLNALAWSFALIPRGESTGSLSIPNTISAQPAGNLAASLLDANWTAGKDYINNRQVTIGTFAARPAPQYDGRYYLATDVDLGTFYVDT